VADLSGKVAVVLGASAEGGTGWAIAERLARRGASVVVGARSLEPLQRLAAKINGHAVRCDAGREADIVTLRDAAVARYGRIDIAVNSAATPALAAIKDLTLEILQLGTQVNYFGMALFVKYSAEAMGSSGSIILISTMGVTHPIFPAVSYGCAKAAMECLVRYAALEYGPRNISVNSIRAGTIDSEMARSFFGSPGVAKRFEHEIPLGRLGRPEDIADCVEWLATGAYVTGCSIDVSGGNQLNRFPFLGELPGGGLNYHNHGALYDREHGRGQTFAPK